MMVELSDSEARIFRALLEANALGLKGGSATIHFDGTGRPAKVEVITYTTL